MTATSATGVVDLPAVAAQLDQDILETERRLAELRALREHTEALCKYAAALRNAAVHVQQPPTTSRTSLVDQVVQVFLNEPDAIFEVSEVVGRLAANGVEAEAGSVRNAIYYAEGSQHRLVKKGRGRFTLKKPSTPADNGVDVDGPPIWAVKGDLT